MKSKILLYVGVIIFSTLFLTGCTSKEKVHLSDGLVGEAQEFYKEREYKKAIDKFTEALEVYPGNFDAYVGFMNVLLDKGYLEEAEDLAEQSFSRLSKDDAAVIYSMVGEKYYEIGDFESAEEILQPMKGNDIVDFNLAQVYVQKGDVEKAQKLLKGSLKEPESYLLYSYLALQDWDKGLETISKVDLNEVEDETLRERISNLIEIYTISDKDYLFKDTSLAGEYVNAGYPYLAIKILDEHGEEIAEYGDAQYFLGNAYLNSGEYKKAIEKLNSALLLDMSGVEVYVSLARAYLLNKDLEKALDTYKAAASAMDLEKEEWVAREYVDVLLENNMVSVATKLLTELITQRDSFALNVILVDVYHREGNLDKMGDVLDKLRSKANLNQGETQELVRYEILYSLADSEDLVKVEDLIEMYIVYDRYNAETFLFEAKLFIKKGQTAEAKESLERAIELDLEGQIAEEASKLLATLG